MKFADTIEHFTLKNLCDERRKTGANSKLRTAPLHPNSEFGKLRDLRTCGTKILPHHTIKRP